MASHSPYEQDAPLSSSSLSPTTNTSEALLAESETVELSSLNARHESASTSLLRRASTVSTASDTSSRTQMEGPSIVQRATGYISSPFSKFGTTIQNRMRQSRFHGWRMGVLIGSCMSAFVLCGNIIAVVVGSPDSFRFFGSPASSGYKNPWRLRELMSGSSTVISQWNTAFHILVNAASTILLAASNYTVQVLSASTRSEVDAAHARGQWLDVGVLSFRNLRYLPRKRVALCLLLGFSSIPLHLL
jgi:hypothetical protein